MGTQVYQSSTDRRPTKTGYLTRETASSDWPVGKLSSWLMTEVVEPGPLRAVLHQGRVMGCKRQLTKQVMDSKPVSSILLWLLLYFTPWVPALTSLHGGQ